MPVRARLAFALALIVGLTAYLGLPVDEPTARLLAITLFCITLWITNPVPPYFTGILGLGLIGLVHSSELAFSGFQSPAIWLIVFGLVIGEATRQSGLAAWLGELIADRTPIGPADSPRRVFGKLLFGLCGVAILLTLLIPSSLVRILMLLPVLGAIGEGFESADARTGLVLGPSLATFFGSPGVLTANLPAIIASGIVESVSDVTITWTEWFTHMYLVSGLGRALVIAVVIYYLYRPGPATDVHVTTTTRSGFEGRERRMVAFLLLGTTFWATDFLHGAHPVFGALVVAVGAMAPSIGVIDIDAVGSIDFSIVFFVGAVFAIGNGLESTGFTDTAATVLLGYVPTAAPTAVVLGAVFGVTFLLAFLMEGLAVASVLTPILASFAQAAGVPLDAVVMIEALALNTYFFPYQSAVLVAILAEDVVEATELIRASIWCSLAVILVMLPLQIQLLVMVG